LSSATAWNRSISARQHCTDFLVEGNSQGDIALVRFLPELRERLFSAEQLRPATEELLQVAARLDGVVDRRFAFEQSADRPSIILDDKAKEHKRQTVHEPTAVTAIERRIIDTLRGFGLDTSAAASPVVGPSFIRFRLKLKASVPVKKILSHNEDIGVPLGIETSLVQIEDGVLVIDVSRGEERETVPFGRIRETLAPRHPLQGNSKIPLGLDLNGQLRSIDLASAESPHVLVAGTAGSGKSD
jgi:DNA segregation ATPase FtsK/SpoIIIE-like protein